MVAYELFSAQDTVGVDVQIFSSQADATLTSISDCLQRELIRTDVPLVRLRSVLGSGISDGCFSGFVGAAAALSFSPCGSALCKPLVDVAPAQPAAPFPWYAVVIPIVVVAIIVAFLLLKTRLGTFVYRKASARRYVDSGKYTLGFLPDTKDEDVQLYSKRRATVIEAADAPTAEEVKARSHSTRSKSIIDRIVRRLSIAPSGQPKEIDLSQAEDFDIPLNPEVAQKVEAAKTKRDFSDI